METLNLSYHALTSLPAGLFSGLVSLETLDLSGSPYLAGNNLATLPEGIFSGLTSLETLSLTGNELASLPEGVFSGLASLETLNLSYHALTSLPAGLFSGLVSLETLDLSGSPYLAGNNLATLPEGIFSGLASLETLSLTGNELASLPEGVFSGLASLGTLDLAGNNLATLPEGIFSGLASLETLRLSSNGLTSLPEGIFSGLVSLKDLTLDYYLRRPLLINVSLEWVDPGRFQARVHTGAPFEMSLPITVTNGTLDGDSSHLTIPTGREASDVFSVSRRPGTTSPVTVEIAQFPDKPSSQIGYELVKAALPLPVLGALSLDFAHFANGASIRSDLVIVNVSATPIRPALYFFDKEGDLIAPASVVNLGADQRVRVDGSLTMRAEIEPLGELTVSTHGRGPLVTGSVKVLAAGPMGGVLRFDSPDIGVAGVGTAPPLQDAIFPARRQESGINTGAAIRNLGEDPMTVSCQLLQRTNLRDEVEFSLAGNGQTAQFIDELFTGTYTGNFVGSVRCSAEELFAGVALEMDFQNQIFTTLPMVPIPPIQTEDYTQLYFSHFANGASITSDLVLVNVAGWTISPAIYFYDGEGGLIAPESVVDMEAWLQVRVDGALTIRSYTAGLGELTISTHGRGPLVTGSVKIIAGGRFGGFLRFNNSEIGVAGVGASEAVQDAIFPARHQVRGIRTGMAIRNLKQKALVVTCQLMRDGRVLEEKEIPLSGNGQTARFIHELFAKAVTSDFEGSVRCTAPNEGRFTGLALEMDADNRIFTTLPVVPVRR